MIWNAGHTAQCARHAGFQLYDFQNRHGVSQTKTLNKNRESRNLLKSQATIVQGNNRQMYAKSQHLDALVGLQAHGLRHTFPEAMSDYWGDMAVATASSHPRPGALHGQTA
jgi:hypothetical protein